MRIRVAVAICSHCEKPAYRDHNRFASNKSIGKSLFVSHKHSSCSLHQTGKHDFSTYIGQRRGSKCGTSRHHRLGQQNSQRNFDPTSTTLVDTYSPAASSSSSPANMFYFVIAASSRSTATRQSSLYRSLQRPCNVLCNTPVVS